MKQKVRESQKNLAKVNIYAYTYVLKTKFPINFGSGLSFLVYSNHLLALKESLVYTGYVKVELNDILQRTVYFQME